MTRQPGGEIILYPRSEGEPAIEVRLDGETVWLTQDQMADLFGRAKSTINEHIKSVFEEGELVPEQVMRKFGISEFSTKPTNLYNLDVIISVGYRVKSQQGTQFRIWATQRLREYLVKGFTMDDARLKNLGGGSYWKELLDRIRDIRSSEKVLYRQVLDLYATSVDYDPGAKASLSFFKTVQNKLHYAAHGQTAAEVIKQRADAGKPFMGLLSFSGARPTKAEVGNAKNYLNANELKRLNTLVSAYFDAAEFRAMNHEPTYMKDWLSHLEQLITAMGGKALQGSGKISHQAALAHAEAEYAKFRAQQDVLPSDVEAAYLQTVKAAAKKITAKKKP
ncbi:MAG: cell filamentation protein Fic [Comamonas sp. SCN 67-35]|uniref:virulence RhuM family protein n=1 Tax=unclassified Comamonas TaxID=2638500 RepID=UPI00086F91F0|nr:MULTISPECIES: virulence RhuM family protein [unclassified Comamonas]MBN9331263.1 virulence RhuM family protein [Comamonas sp.]ODU37554.1 MAG: cell filamentation protein Fic [Comamonas sp. SCN 67-35]OJX02437.1 MAG: cell filamentation protein Fic [Burkholderiales bacterium 66-26]